MNIASKALNIPCNAIYKVCFGELKQTKGFVFIKESMYSSNYKFPGSDTSRVRKVGQYNLNGELIQEYPTCTAAGQAINGDRKKISKCCKNELESYKGYIFKYI